MIPIENPYFDPDTRVMYIIRASRELTEPEMIYYITAYVNDHGQPPPGTISFDAGFFSS